MTFLCVVISCLLYCREVLKHMGIMTDKHLMFVVCLCVASVCLRLSLSVCVCMCMCLCKCMLIGGYMCGWVWDRYVGGCGWLWV